jgi:hypothetical protein
MSGVRHSSSASVPTEFPAGSPTSSQPEAEMKDKIPREFECVTFVDDLTAQGAPLQADPNDVQRVLDHLRDNCELTHVTLFSDGNSTAEDPRLPFNGFTVETGSYEPFAHLLNRIVHSANLCLISPRYLEALRFYPSGSEILEKLDSGKPLKPDILGLLRSCTPQEPKVSWNDVAVFIEVKAHLLVDTVKQLGTYARIHLTFNRRRSFSIAMSFHHKELTLRFLCFHRSGISTSTQLHLCTGDGFRSLVEHMIGLLSIKDEEAFGFDMTRVKDVYRLNNIDYKIVRTIQMCESIRGHATAVYSLKRAKLTL